MDESQLQAELERLPNANLLALARNSSAHARQRAIELLVLRGASESMHPDIVSESYNLVLSNPLVLKKINPASAATAAVRLPGVVDCLAHEKQIRTQLASTVGDNHSTIMQRAAVIEQTVSVNKEAQTKALSETSTALATNFTNQHSALKTSLETLILELRGEYEEEISAAKARLDLLERSLYRKIVDALKSAIEKLRSRFKKHS